MKLQIREQLHHITFPETTSLTPPVEIAKTKGAKKRVKSSQCDSSTTRSPSYWEHVDSKFPDSQPSQSKPLIPKRKTARMGIFSPKPTPILRNPLIHHMPLFMHSYIEDIIDVKGNGHCGFRVVAEHLGKGEESHVLIRRALIRELNMFRSDYLNIYGNEERLQYINDGLYPPKIMPISGIAPVDKWLTFPDMGHILATTYNKVVVELTKLEIWISETFFPLRGPPPSNPFSRILCLGLIPNHFVYVKLKDGCPLPPTCKEWRIHRAKDAETWEYKFLDRQSEFEELMKIEKGEHQKNKENPIIVIDEDEIKL
jgi:histone-lysine N-methyltransferase SETD2